MIALYASRSHWNQPGFLVSSVALKKDRVESIQIPQKTGCKVKPEVQ